MRRAWADYCNASDGVVILIAIILVAGKASGLIGSNNDTDKKI